MKNLEEIKAIVIPTCDSFDPDGIEDFNRANTAIDFVNKNNLPKRCIIAGLGVHKDLHNYLLENTDWKIGVDINSLNSIENILQVFPKEVEGEYALVSFPLHLKRFRKIINDAKKADLVSKNLEVFYVPTTQHPKWFFYEFLSNIKYHLKGKRKYFNK
jgi:hypothetical protein